MEIGRAITMEEESFRKIYNTHTQESFLKSVQFLKKKPNTPPNKDEKGLNVF
jgi:hypothetical protein